MAPRMCLKVSTAFSALGVTIRNFGIRCGLSALRSAVNTHVIPATAARRLFPERTPAMMTTRRGLLSPIFERSQPKKRMI